MNDREREFELLWPIHPSDRGIDKQRLYLYYLRGRLDELTACRKRDTKFLIGFVVLMALSFAVSYLIGG